MTQVLVGPDAAAEPLVLASASRTRAGMLERAGLAFEIVPPRVDEAAVRTSMIAEAAPVEAGAELLADLKALGVSQARPAALVIGADQILECDGRWFEKPDSAEHARDQLTALAGRRHRLISGVVVAVNGTRIWHHVDEARLTMRPLSDGFLERYLQAVGDQAFETVGGYQLEGLGVQLFSAIEGDHFTILGLPLLPLLDFLRSHGVLES